MTAQTPTVLKSYFETGDRPTAVQYGDFIDTACGYKSYVALLSQSGTLDPVMTVLQNTLGGTPVFTRESAGIYPITLAGAFTAKTFTLVSGVVSPQDGVFCSIRRITNDTCYLYSVDVTGTSYDIGVDNVAVEIRVYP